MSYYYAPYQRPIEYYNPSIPNGQNVGNYQQIPQYQQTAQQAVIPAQSASDMIFVLNETEAMAYPVALNNNVILWDKNKDTVYIKSNMQGVPSMRILDYTERITDNSKKAAAEAINASTDKFVRVDDFERLREKIEGLQGELDELKSKQKPKAIKKEISEDE